MQVENQRKIGHDINRNSNAKVRTVSFRDPSQGWELVSGFLTIQFPSFVVPKVYVGLLFCILMSSQPVEIPLAIVL